MPATPLTPAISVILCTYNPNPTLLAEVLTSLANQTLPTDQWELLLIDNNSSPPINAASLPPVAGASRPRLPLKIIPEPTPGLNHARLKGIESARANLLVFVDDDNLLDPDYLQVALQLSQSQPTLGAYGGLTRPRLTSTPPRWKRRLLDKLGVRDNGPSPLTSTVDKWGPHEPIGAGLVLRKEVAQYFSHLMKTSPHAPRLDRSGPTGLMSGGDTLMARSAYRVNLACSYQPSLKLTHVIHPSRFQFKYLLRILHAHGKSVVVLNRTLSVPVPRMTLPGLLLRFPYRLLTRGIPGCIIYAWDIGYYQESHRPS